jgi:hypothetical protein
LEEDDWTKDVSSRRGVPKRSEDDANDKYGPIVAERKAQSIAARKPNIHGEPIYTERRGSKGVCRETDEQKRDVLVNNDETMTRTQSIQTRATTRDSCEDTGSINAEITRSNEMTMQEQSNVEAKSKTRERAPRSSKAR